MMIRLEVWKSGSLRNCKWTDKFGSLEVYKIVNGLTSLEVWAFGSLQNLKWTDKFGSFEVSKFACCLW